MNTGAVGGGPSYEHISDMPVTIRPLGGELRRIFSASALDRRFTTVEGHGAPCFVSAVLETWNENAQSGCCGPVISPRAGSRSGAR